MADFIATMQEQVSQCHGEHRDSIKGSVDGEDFHDIRKKKMFTGPNYMIQDMDAWTVGKMKKGRQLQLFIETTRDNTGQTIPCDSQWTPVVSLQNAGVTWEIGKVLLTNGVRANGTHVGVLMTRNQKVGVIRARTLLRMVKIDGKRQCLILLAMEGIQSKMGN
ncbi:hypothetical protein HPP92_018195 [Vanilla planifolia]|uniref:Uncharacterized protein n=1 Tax=Vanilla planifolia TaxID=51239 RepID=A0A835QJI1_VANPL|nr:hypothetical protein HPP92_018195 [Vanilla planifolia]